MTPSSMVAGHPILTGTVLLWLIAGCAAGGPSANADLGSDGPAGTPPQTLALVVTGVDPTFVTEDHFIASIEMQLSGEPLAESMRRDLRGFSRDYACSDRGE